MVKWMRGILLPCEDNPIYPTHASRHWPSASTSMWTRRTARIWRYTNSPYHNCPIGSCQYMYTNCVLCIPKYYASEIGCLFHRVNESGISISKLSVTVMLLNLHRLLLNGKNFQISSNCCNHSHTTFRHARIRTCTKSSPQSLLVVRWNETKQ